MKDGLKGFLLPEGRRWLVAHGIARYGGVVLSVRHVVKWDRLLKAS
jgi:hypothetical protein